MIYLFSAIILLGVLIAIHEYGHFIVGTESPAIMPGTRPQLLMDIAVTTDERPAIDPTLKSISAAAIT